MERGLWAEEDGSSQYSKSKCTWTAGAGRKESYLVLEGWERLGAERPLSTIAYSAWKRYNSGAHVWWTAELTVSITVESHPRQLSVFASWNQSFSQSMDFLSPVSLAYMDTFLSVACYSWKAPKPEWDPGYPNKAWWEWLWLLERKPFLNSPALGSAWVLSSGYNVLPLQLQLFLWCVTLQLNNPCGNWAL